ncbi:hypothetical protein F4774DRAFT_366771 [Daldinia eschscholtzii]|nr:hypothetical protein F4774DRAFT_366771 [Daldinia eschscholtzii]
MRERTSGMLTYMLQATNLVLIVHARYIHKPIYRCCCACTRKAYYCCDIVQTVLPPCRCPAHTHHCLTAFFPVIVYITSSNRPDEIAKP